MTDSQTSKQHVWNEIDISMYHIANISHSPYGSDISLFKHTAKFCLTSELFKLPFLVVGIQGRLLFRRGTNPLCMLPPQWRRNQSAVTV